VHRHHHRRMLQMLESSHENRGLLQHPKSIIQRLLLQDS
jgi:hypothetical protein